MAQRYKRERLRPVRWRPLTGVSPVDRPKVCHFYIDLSQEGSILIEIHPLRQVALGLKCAIVVPPRPQRTHYGVPFGKHVILLSRRQGYPPGPEPNRSAGAGRLRGP